MRRYVQILGLMVLAFAASGWGSIIAAALCPHATLKAAKVVRSERTLAEPSCHSVKPRVAAKPDCHHDSSMEDEGQSPAFGLADNTPCTHCLSKPEVPASNVIAVQKLEQKRSLDVATVQTASFVIPAIAFIRPVLYRQGAPPGSTTPKHLLVSVLLI
jgi:hypothetical protein